MKARDAGRTVLLLLVPFMLLLASCDSDVNAPVTPEDEVAYKIDCFMPDGSDQPAFLATGAIEDSGIVEGPPLPWNPEYEDPETWSGHRVLRGDKGQLRLFVDVERVMEGSLIAKGRFMTLDGTGAYAAFRGEGEFIATVDEKGSLMEVFEGETDRNYH